MQDAEAFAGDQIPDGTQRIELRVAQLQQLFNQIDPSPFNDRDLDPRVEEFIVSWGRELPRNAPVGLLVHLQRSPGSPHEAQHLREAVHNYFRQRSARSRQRLRHLFRSGRISLVIGVAFLAAALATRQFINNALKPSGIGLVFAESLVIGGWVALWRPIEVFLYDWWPIAAERRLYDRLASMPVQLHYEPTLASVPPLFDWPQTDTNSRSSISFPQGGQA